jgi:hypothetical protein
MSVLKATQKDEPEILSKPANKRTASRKRVFLDAYADCGNVRAAAAAAGSSREAHYKWLESDAEYRTTFEALADRVGQELEDLAVDRVHVYRDVLPNKAIAPLMIHQKQATAPQRASCAIT